MELESDPTAGVETEKIGACRIAPRRYDLQSPDWGDSQGKCPGFFNTWVGRESMGDGGKSLRLKKT